MPDPKNWRDAKLPKWAYEGIEAELNAARQEAALSWPKRPRPEPVFVFGGYGQQASGPAPEDRTYYRAAYVDRRLSSVEYQRLPVLGVQFHFGKAVGTSTTTSGPYFATVEDAVLYGQWAACDDAARCLSVYAYGVPHVETR